MEIPEEALLKDEQIYAITSAHPRFVRRWPGARALADAASHRAYLQGVTKTIAQYRPLVVEAIHELRYTHAGLRLRAALTAVEEA